MARRRPHSIVGLVTSSFRHGSPLPNAHPTTAQSVQSRAPTDIDDACVSQSQTEEPQQKKRSDRNDETGDEHHGRAVSVPVVDESRTNRANVLSHQGEIIPAVTKPIPAMPQTNATNQIQRRSIRAAIAESPIAICSVVTA